MMKDKNLLAAALIAAGNALYDGDYSPGIVELLVKAHKELSSACECEGFSPNEVDDMRLGRPLRTEAHVAHEAEVTQARGCKRD